MRQDKSDALREKLRRGTEEFDFDALLQGVSTVDEPSAAPATVASPSADQLDAPRGVEVPQSTTPDQQDRERLRTALEHLGGRLLEESGKFRAALASYDAQEAGYYLARLNQVLELLHSVDPGGETARRLSLPAAPPPGRSWPAACWTLYELAESPLSGLFPGDADDQFAAEVVEAAVVSTEA